MGWASGTYGGEQKCIHCSDRETWTKRTTWNAYA